MKNKWLLLVALMGALMAIRIWQTAHTVKRFTKYDHFFGSYVKVDVCYQDSQRQALESALDKVWTRFADIHSRLSVYDPASDINAINKAYQTPTTVPQDTYQRVKNSLEYHKISKGVFDITVGPLIQLWKEQGRQGVMPTQVQIQGALSMVDIKSVELLEGDQVRLAREGVKINLDSTGDGFAADEAARILRAGGFTDFLVDASGELYAGGVNCKGAKWRIGIRDPHDTENLIDVVELSSQAVSTSGTYEQYFEINGEQWSHIIDPRSGYPARGVTSATVIAPSAEFADFLSTAFCILPAEESVGIIDGFGPGHAALMVLDGEADGKRVASGQYPHFAQDE